MPPSDGVVQYDLNHQPASAPPTDLWRPVDAWRTILKRVGLIGQDPKRYEGFGFGNISCRTSVADPAAAEFVITGTQTGALDQLTGDHFTRVTGCDPEQNRILSEGPVAPSSEAMTHGAIYQSSPKVNAVVHCHSPEIWHRAEALSLRTTPADIPYGTPAMATAAADQAIGPSGLFVMNGHPDGVVTYAATLAEAAMMTLNVLAEALASGEMTDPHR